MTVMKCDLCGSGQPTVRCEQCDHNLFCASCDDRYHRHPKRQTHTRTVSYRVFEVFLDDKKSLRFIRLLRKSTKLDLIFSQHRNCPSPFWPVATDHGHPLAMKLTSHFKKGKSEKFGKFFVQFSLDRSWSSSATFCCLTFSFRVSTPSL